MECIYEYNAVQRIKKGVTHIELSVKNSNENGNHTLATLRKFLYP